MKSFKILVDSFLLNVARPGLIAVTAAVLSIIIITVVFTARELKKQEKEKNAEQSASDNGEVPDTDGDS